MIISADRQSHFAYLITSSLKKERFVEFTDDEKAMRFAKKKVREFVDDLILLDNTIRKKISSLKRGVFEGSLEWDILYSKYLKDEMIKKGIYY